MSRNTYDDDPVYYCKRCLSLNIRQMPIMESMDYCDDCGCVDIGQTDIDHWNEMYRAKYGHDYIIKKERKWPYWC
jgi:hypothetical protein